VVKRTYVKNGSFIAGYNAQFMEENKYELIVYAYISNKTLILLHFWIS